MAGCRVYCLDVWLTGWVQWLVPAVGSGGWLRRFGRLAGSGGWFRRLVLAVRALSWFRRVGSGGPGGSASSYGLYSHLVQYDLCAPPQGDPVLRGMPGGTSQASNTKKQVVGGKSPVVVGGQ